MTPTPHPTDCRICATVDRWVADGNLRLRPTTRSGQNDLAGVWGAASRDESARSESPDGSLPQPSRA